MKGWREGQGNGMSTEGWKGFRVEGAQGMDEDRDLGKGKIREALDGVPKSFTFTSHLMGGF